MSLRDVNYNNLPDNVHDDHVTWLTWKTRWRHGDWTLLNTAWHYQADRDWKKHVPLPVRASHCHHASASPSTATCRRTCRAA